MSITPTMKAAPRITAPVATKIAVSLLAASFSFGLVLGVISAAAFSVPKQIGIVVMALLLVLLLRCLYHGRNWARIVICVMIGLSFFGMPEVLHKSGFDLWRALAQMTLQLVALVLLFTTSSRKWFRAT